MMELQLFGRLHDRQKLPRPSDEVLEAARAQAVRLAEFDDAAQKELSELCLEDAHRPTEPKEEINDALTEHYVGHSEDIRRVRFVFALHVAALVAFLAVVPAAVLLAARIRLTAGLIVSLGTSAVLVLIIRYLANQIIAFYARRLDRERKLVREELSREMHAVQRRLSQNRSSSTHSGVAPNTFPPTRATRRAG
jgi:hypothetical protein